VTAQQLGGNQIAGSVGSHRIIILFYGVDQPLDPESTAVEMALDFKGYLE
jgi:hypothetical protein